MRAFFQRCYIGALIVAAITAMIFIPFEWIVWGKVKLIHKACKSIDLEMRKLGAMEKEKEFKAAQKAQAQAKDLGLYPDNTSSEEMCS